jgi:hypothetical protein
MANQRTPSDSFPSCPCGTTRTSRAAVVERDYSLLGAVYLLWGGTSRPIRVTFRCVFCGNTFDECTNVRELGAYVT